MRIATAPHRPSSRQPLLPGLPVRIFTSGESSFRLWKITFDIGLRKEIGSGLHYLSTIEMF
jgi:hypothetical protein